MDELQITHYFVQEALEGTSRVSQIERHSQKFKRSKWSYYSIFWYVGRIYWYLIALTRSSLEKVLQPCREEAKSCICGIELRSGTVMTFSRR